MKKFYISFSIAATDDTADLYYPDEVFDYKIEVEAESEEEALKTAYKEAESKVETFNHTTGGTYEIWDEPELISYEEFMEE